MLKVRPFRGGGWEVDIRFRLPNGQQVRERRKSSVSSKSAATRWAEARERELLINGLQTGRRKEVPTLEAFVERFLDGHARANRLKPSTLDAQQVALRSRLVPSLGTRALDAITNEDVQRLKQSMADLAPKTVNNVLSVLSTLLKKAVEWNVIDRMPCTVRLLKVPKPSAMFHDFADFERLVTAAAAIDPRAQLIVLLGGEAGLRAGEMMALEWRDVDLTKRQLCVERSDWRGQVTSPKGGRLRYVPLTVRLAAALRAARHLRGPRVLMLDDGKPLEIKAVQRFVRLAARRAGLTRDGVHVLRHTFCSHLAMRGAPARAIQELAGHADLGTTQRYMHVSPAAIENAIRLLDQAVPLGGRGETVETASGALAK